MTLKGKDRCKNNKEGLIPPASVTWGKRKVREKKNRLNSTR